jgi:signal transduction histidine kinase
MIRVLGCIVDQHDLRFVVLAGVLCVCVCAAAMSMIARARVADGWARSVWIGCSGVVAGFGIWATHFVAMLAYETSFPISFAPAGTFVSMLVAALMCGVGFWVSLSRFGGLAGGALTGLAIVTMHYIGMSAVRAPADQVWDMDYVLASVVIGVTLMAFGMWIVIHYNTLKSYVAGTAIFTFAICSMHFTGMSAFALDPNPTVAVSQMVMAPGTLAVGIAAGAFFVVAVGLTGVLFDSQQSHVRDLVAAKAQLEELTQGLQVALEASQRASRAKAAFFATMSHELRTPLNAIIGFSEMLQAQIFGPLGHPRNSEYIDDIHSSGTKLLSLVNDVLDISRMNAGKMELREETFSLVDLINKALRMTETQAAKAGVRVTRDVQPDLPRLLADSKRIEQAILNLLSNAIKFTPNGGHIKVSTSRQTDGLRITVDDNGIGIAREDLARLFERFVQIDSGLARRYEGAGLGLQISKQLIELHGGTLILESTQHVGTTATITLPAFRIVEPSEDVVGRTNQLASARASSNWREARRA